MIEDTYHILPHVDGWQMQRERDGSTLRLFVTRLEGVLYAVEYVHRYGGIFRSPYAPVSSSHVPKNSVQAVS